MPKEDLSPAALARVLRQSGVSCPAHALPGLESYTRMLMRWNRVMNLVGARSWQDAAADLLPDCLRLAGFLERLPLPPAPLCWDLGAGAGLPGVPLRLIWQRGSYHMVEKRSKRALFLSQVLGTLNLPATHVHNEDATAFFGDAKADLILSRAFLPWPEVLALTRTHLSGKGFAVFMGRMVPGQEELADQPGGPWVLAEQETYACRSGTRVLWAARPV